MELGLPTPLQYNGPFDYLLLSGVPDALHAAPVGQRVFSPSYK